MESYTGKSSIGWVSDNYKSASDRESRRIYYDDSVRDRVRGKVTFAETMDLERGEEDRDKRGDDSLKYLKGWI